MSKARVLTSNRDVLHLVVSGSPLDTTISVAFLGAFAALFSLCIYIHRSLPYHNPF